MPKYLLISTHPAVENYLLDDLVPKDGGKSPEFSTVCGFDAKGAWLPDARDAAYRLIALDTTMQPDLIEQSATEWVAQENKRRAELKQNSVLCVVLKGRDDENAALLNPASEDYKFSLGLLRRPMANILVVNDQARNEIERTLQVKIGVAHPMCQAVVRF